MATLTALPAAARSYIKPTRSMTHPLRDPRTGGKRKTKQGEPFDPEELTRRLTAHLVEQRVKAEKRRAAKEAKAAADALFHYVPKSAAEAFERTMTPEAMRSVPKIAQPAIRAHLDSLKIDDHAATQAISLQKTQKRDQQIMERDLLRNRNQFQWNQDLEEANEMDWERDLYKMPQRTFNSDFAHLRSSKPKSARPMSTGDVFWEEDFSGMGIKDLSLVSPKPRAKTLHDRNDRNDWAQREDDLERRNKKEKANPELKKRESNWILLGIKSIKQEKENAGHSPPDPAKMKVGFLARFKRHPS